MRKAWEWFYFGSEDGPITVALKGMRAGLILFCLGALIFWLIGCASAPTKAFNAEDKQDGSCYSTLGGGIGYCNK